MDAGILPALSLLFRLRGRRYSACVAAGILPALSLLFRPRGRRYSTGVTHRFSSPKTIDLNCSSMPENSALEAMHCQAFAVIMKLNIFERFESLSEFAG